MGLSFKKIGKTIKNTVRNPLDAVQKVAKIQLGTAVGVITGFATGGPAGAIVGGTGAAIKSIDTNTKSRKGGSLRKTLSNAAGIGAISGVAAVVGPQLLTAGKGVVAKGGLTKAIGGALPGLASKFSRGAKNAIQEVGESYADQQSQPPMDINSAAAISSGKQGEPITEQIKKDEGGRDVFIKNALQTLADKIEAVSGRAAERVELLSAPTPGATSGQPIVVSSGAESVGAQALIVPALLLGGFFILPKLWRRAA